MLRVMVGLSELVANRANRLLMTSAMSTALNSMRKRPTSILSVVQVRNEGRHADNVRANGLQEIGLVS